jgi:hypothetical protein
MTSALRYDAAGEPEEGWLEHDEQLRLDAIARYHQRLEADHPDMPNLLVHASVHLVIENQLAMDEPAAVRLALKRLLAGGLTRHEALHQIGIPLTQFLFSAMRGEGSVTVALEQYERALRKL